MKIKKNDTVLVIQGKDKGKKGKVRTGVPEEDRIFVEGINMVKQHVKARGQAKQAGIVAREAPIAVSKVMLVCTKCGKPTRVKMLFLEGGKRVRRCQRCNEVID